MIDFLQILLFSIGKVTGDEVGWEREGQNCRTIPASGSGTKFGRGSMQPQAMYYLISIQNIDGYTGLTDVFGTSAEVFGHLRISSEPYKKPWHSQEKNVTPINKKKLVDPQWT